MTWRRGVSKLGKDPQCVVPPSGRSPARRRQTLQCGVARSSQPCPPARCFRLVVPAHTLDGGEFETDRLYISRQTFRSETRAGPVVTVYAVPVASHVTEVGPMYRRAYVCAGGGASHGPSARRTPLDAAESAFMLIHIPTTISYSK